MVTVVLYCDTDAAMPCTEEFNPTIQTAVDLHHIFFSGTQNAFVLP